MFKTWLGSADNRSPFYYLEFSCMQEAVGSFFRQRSPWLPCSALKRARHITAGVTTTTNSL